VKLLTLKINSLFTKLSWTHWGSTQFSNEPSSSKSTKATGISSFGINFVDTNHSFIFNNSVQGNGSTFEYALRLWNLQNISVENNILNSIGTGAGTRGVSIRDSFNNGFFNNSLEVTGPNSEGIVYEFISVNADDHNFSRNFYQYNRN